MFRRNAIYCAQSKYICGIGNHDTSTILISISQTSLLAPGDVLPGLDPESAGSGCGPNNTSAIIHNDRCAQKRNAVLRFYCFPKRVCRVFERKGYVSENRLDCGDNEWADETFLRGYGGGREGEKNETKRFFLFLVLR